MVSHTQDPNTFLLIPLIQSALKLKTSKKCLENEKLSETGHFGKEIIEFKRHFCSASKIPDGLMGILVKICIEDPGFTEKVSKEVFNCEIVTSHRIRFQFQIKVIKLFIFELEKNGVPAPDSFFDRLGVLMGMKDEKFVERLYLTETGDKVLAKFNESINQLSMGTTGLAVWQASADLANLFRLIPVEDYKRVVELGSGCGVSGVAVAKLNECQVVLTDYDENVLKLLRENAVKNGLIDKDMEVDSSKNQSIVRCLDWCDFDSTEWKDPTDFIIAADVVYDTALLASLCNVLRLLLRHSKAAIVACTRRNENSIECFEHHLKCANLEAVEKFEYENGEFRFGDDDSTPFSTIFPFFSTLKTPTIFYNIQPKK